MSKQKSITEQIEELQSANRTLLEYVKLFDKACVLNFGHSSKSIRKMITGTTGKTTDFESRLCAYFSLHSDSEKEAFLNIICSDSTLRFYNGKKQNSDCE